MSMGLSILSIILKTLGMLFLFAAALGLLRFKDPLQRMHAATKAGTIGAGLVLAGVVLLIDSTEGRMIGLLAIFFLFLTAPVAGHLLGRAAYVSGTELVGVGDKDALKGILARQNGPLEQRLMPTAAVIPSLACVRFAIIAPHEDLVARRARDIAMANGVAVEARAIIDAKLLQATTLADQARESIKARLADAVTTVQTLFSQKAPKLSLFYTEGDAEKLIPDALRAGSLLVLPPSGWCLHDVELQTAETAIQPNVLRLHSLHAGPVLYTGETLPPTTATRVVVLDDGTDNIVAGLLWALKTNLWVAPIVTIVTRPGDSRTVSIKRALTEDSLDVPVETIESEAFDGILTPDTLSECDAVIVSSLSQQCHEGDNLLWRGRIAKTWTGEILVIPYLAQPSEALY